MTGWMTGQLPQVMQAEPVITSFIGAAEGIADSIRFQIDAVELLLDPDTAVPPMLAYLASWLGFALDTSDDPELLRRLVKQLGLFTRNRGTGWALTTLVELLSGAAAEVTDTGGVFGPGEAVPATDPVVHVRLRQAGPLGLARLTDIITAELPVGVRVDITTANGQPDQEPSR